MTVFSPGTGIPLHSHNVEESVLVYEGEATAVVGDDEFDLVAGQATWVPAGVPHCFRNRGEGTMTIYWVYGGRDVTRTITATGETFEHLSESDRGATPGMSAVVTLNPATGERLAEYPAFSDADVDAALDRAAAAQAGWAALSFAERAAVLRRAAAVLRAEVEDLALLVTREMGKPLAESRAEVEKCATACDYYADHAGDFLADEPVATSADRSWIGYEPVGVVLAVMPWNFPLWQVLRFAAPALMAGNAALLKHSPNTTGCALAVAAGARRGRRARGAVRRPRRRRARRPGRHPAADRGPAHRRGHDHRQRAGRPRGRLGRGRRDQEVGARAGRLRPVRRPRRRRPAARGRTWPRGAGSSTPGRAASRRSGFVVDASVAEEFTRLLVAEVEALTVGDPEAAGTDVGPMAREDLLEGVHRQVEASVAAGARLLAGGQRLDRPGQLLRTDRAGRRRARVSRPTTRRSSARSRR